MKKILVLLLVLAMLCVGCGSSDKEEMLENEETIGTEENNNTEVEFPYDYASAEFFEIANCWNYAPQAVTSSLLKDGADFKLNAVDGYMTMQGGCTDGTYMYLLLENKRMTDPDTGASVSYCMLFKVEMASWTVVAQSEPLRVDHGNSITYNPNTNQLMIAHCKNRTQEFSYVDPNTLTITGEKNLGRNFHSMGYSAGQDKYVIGIKGTHNFVVYDNAFNKLGEYEGVAPASGVGYQALTCDDDYIYILYCGTTNAIMCYHWDGAYAGCYKVDFSPECEALMFAGDDCYMSFYTGSGGTVRKIEFDKELLF